VIRVTNFWKKAKTRTFELSLPTRTIYEKLFFKNEKTPNTKKNGNNSENFDEILIQSRHFTDRFITWFGGDNWYCNSAARTCLVVCVHAHFIPNVKRLNSFIQRICRLLRKPSTL
jgi:hypothetical protein